MMCNCARVLQKRGKPPLGDSLQAKRDSTGKGKQKAEMGGHKTQTHTVSLSF